MSNRSEPQEKMPSVRRIADASPLNLEEGVVIERSAEKDGSLEPQGLSDSHSFEIVAVPEFDAEVSAEQFFSEKHGVLTRGSFQKTLNADGDPAETKWDIDIDRSDVKSAKRNTLPARAIDIPESCEARLGPKFAAAIEKMIAFSIQRRWLAEAEAFRKVSLQPNSLSARDRSGISYVLTVAERFADSRADASLVRKLLRANRDDCIVDVKPGRRSASLSSPRVGDVSSIAADKVRSRSPSAKVKSLDRVREVAESQDWLTAKASRAFSKLKGEREQIDRAELAALQYLVDQFDMIIEVQSDVELLRKEIKKILRT